jgi:predicted fused transcriptional regulator/phosphomethylpyrimidine kinase
MTDAFLPAMRHLLALRLRSQGLTQVRISSLLGITQASVSHYLSSGPNRAYSKLSELSVKKAEGDEFASLLAADVRKNAVEGVRRLNAIWTGLLGNGSVCSAHRNIYPSLADCDVCIKEYGHRRGARSAAIAEVAEAVRLLEGSSKFVSVMPEVSVNVACAAGDASTPADIVAVPGRIIRVRGRARAMLPPEAGASIHMSRMLLIVRKIRPDLRACMNLLYDERMAEALKTLGLKTLSIGNYRSRGEDPTVEALESRLKRTSRAFDAIIDEGGNGIEPNVYLFAGGAREVAGLALKLSRVYLAT